MRGKHWVGDVNHSTYCLVSWMNRAINISLRAIFPLHSLVSLCIKILLGSASVLWLEAQSIRLYRFWNRCVINGDIWQLEASKQTARALFWKISQKERKRKTALTILILKNGWEGERRGIDHRSIFRLTDLMQHILTYCIFKVNMFRPGIPVHIYQVV